MSIRTALLASLSFAALALAPTDAAAQTQVASFRAQYAHIYPSSSNPFQIGPYLVRFTLYDDGTWLNTDGNGGEWLLQGNTVTLWFVSRAAATSSSPPFGAATWTGTYASNNVCDGAIRSPGIDPDTGDPTTVQGSWKTRGCP